MEKRKPIHHRVSPVQVVRLADGDTDKMFIVRMQQKVKLLPNESGRCVKCRALFLLSWVGQQVCGEC